MFEHMVQKALTSNAWRESSNRLPGVSAGKHTQEHKKMRNALGHRGLEVFIKPGEYPIDIDLDCRDTEVRFIPVEVLRHKKQSKKVKQ